MKTTQQSNEEKRTWDKLDKSVRRDRRGSDDLNLWIKSHDRTPPKPPLFDTKQKDGCFTALLPILLVLAATVVHLA